jgi:hypothetical protein
MLKCLELLHLTEQNRHKLGSIGFNVHCYRSMFVNQSSQTNSTSKDKLHDLLITIENVVIIE